MNRHQLTNRNPEFNTYDKVGEFTEPQRHLFTTSLCVFVDQVKISPTSEPKHLPALSLPHLLYFIVLWFLAAGWLPDLTWAALFGLETSPAAQLTSSQINSQWQLLSSRRRNGCDKARIVDVIKENWRTRLTFEIHLAENPTHSLLFQSWGNGEAVKSSHPTKTLKSCPCFRAAQSHALFRLKAIWLPSEWTRTNPEVLENDSGRGLSVQLSGQKSSGLFRALTGQWIKSSPHQHVSKIVASSFLDSSLIL